MHRLKPSTMQQAEKHIQLITMSSIASLTLPNSFDPTYGISTARASLSVAPVTGIRFEGFDSAVGAIKPLSTAAAVMKNTGM